jgi:predicted DsbA family dithiol-disulfide isomerase
MLLRWILNKDLEDSHLVEYAIQLDLDIPQFLQDLAGHVHLPRIREDLDSGCTYGVQSTPVFFVGIRHQGAENLESLLMQILQIETDLSS